MAKKWDTGQSSVWKYMTRNKKEVEKLITWRIHSGSCSFWWDDWLGIGPIADYSEGSHRLNNTSVCHFLSESNWNEVKLRQHAPPLLIPRILETKIHLNGIYLEVE